MKVFTYYHPTPQINLIEEKCLQLHWADSWSKAGFEPVVLNEWYARKCPDFTEAYDVVKALPSVNPVGYDLACYLRWLAMSHAPAAGNELFLMTDYDVCCYDAKPFLHYGTKAKKDFTRLISFQGYVPSCVLGTRALFAEQFAKFMAYKPEPDDLHDTTPHTSDQNILCKQVGRAPDSFVRLDIVKSYTEPGWESAPAVHYANSSMIPNHKSPRSKFILSLRSF